MYRILIVDDEQNVLNALRRELQETYLVEVFSDPVVALEQCKKVAFDLVIDDDQIESDLLALFQRHNRIAENLDQICFLQFAPQRIQHILFVIDNQDAVHGDAPMNGGSST